MQKTKNILFIISLTFICPELKAQKKTAVEIDSLLAQSEFFLKIATDSSLKLAFKAAELSQEISNSEYLIKSYQRIAEAYDKSDDADLIINYYQKALVEAQKSSDKKIIAKITLELGRAFFKKGNFDQAELFFRKARVISDKIQDEELQFLVFNALGYSFLVNDYFDTDSAEYFYSLAMKIAEKEKDSIKLATAYVNVAHVYARKGKWNEELPYLLKALEIFQKKNDLEGVSRTYKNIGDIYYFKKENNKAIECYQKEYSLSHQLKNTSGIAIAACDLAYMYAMNKNIQMLDTYASEAKKASKQTKSWRTIQYVGGWISEAYEMVGNTKSALEYFKIYHDASDSINNRERIEKNMRAEAQSNFETKIQQMKAEEEKQIAITDEKTHNQKVVRNILIAGILISLTLLFFTYKNFIAKKKATIVISKQKEEVEFQKQKIEVINKEITDSINYAKIIQQSIFPDPKEIMKVFPQSFGLYIPKSVVSGDFYWFAKKNNIAMIAAVDCTGHGVPGALMSMIGVEKLNEAVANNLTHPSDILSHLNKGVKTTLKQKEAGLGSQDGMDIALCCVDVEKNILSYAGAHRPLWLIRKNHSLSAVETGASEAVKLIEFKPTKTSIGGITSENHKFISREIQIQEGDNFYIFSDGFADQFGGEKGKKMMTKNMKNILLSIQNAPMIDQEKILYEKLMVWKGEHEQVDDILVIGIKI